VLRDTLGPTFRALADPTRRWYLECLLDGNVRLREFCEIFPLSAQTVIHHLRVLEECGLLLSRKQGPMRLYTLRPEGLKEAESWLRRTYATALERRPEDWRRLARL
jgi:DNA-binding transcriptional ArsR family regulator